MTKYYIPIYNWFVSKREFNLNERPIKEYFSCLICKRKFYEKIGKPGNLKKHLKTHKEGKSWVHNFESYQANVQKPVQLD